MIQSSIYSTVSLWPNWSYSSNSKNILLRTFVWWFITFRKNPKCIEESIPIRRLQTFCSSKVFAKTDLDKKVSDGKETYLSSFLAPKLDTKRCFLSVAILVEPERCQSYTRWALGNRWFPGMSHEQKDVLKYTVFADHLHPKKKPRVVQKKWEPRWYFKKISGCTIDRALTVFSLGKNTSIHWASILVLLEFSYAIIFLLHLQMLHVSKRDSRGFKKKKSAIPWYPKKNWSRESSSSYPLTMDLINPRWHQWSFVVSPHIVDCVVIWHDRFKTTIMNAKTSLKNVTIQY